MPDLVNILPRAARVAPERSVPLADLPSRVPFQGLKGAAMERVSKEAYREKLLDPRWQKLRLEVLQRDNWTCQSCEDTKKTLHVHHIYYDREQELEPWEYSPWVLVTLCADCHKAEPDAHRIAVQWLLYSLGCAGIRTAEQLGMVDMSIPDDALAFHKAGDRSDIAFAKALCQGIMGAAEYHANRLQERNDGK